jgi:hypothetical protein
MKTVLTFNEFVAEGKEYYVIVDGNNKFLTRKSISADYSFTDNPNFAYTYDSEKEALGVVSMIKKMPAFRELDITVEKR